MMRICSVQDCSSPIFNHKRGLCLRHYRLDYYQRHAEKKRAARRRYHYEHYKKPPDKGVCEECGVPIGAYTKGNMCTRCNNTGDRNPSAIPGIAHSKICLVSGCGKKSRSRSYCTSHYNRFLVYGNPIMTFPKVIRKCSVLGCKREHKGHGLCALHLQKTPSIRKCLVTGCNRRHYGKGYCAHHFGQQFPRKSDPQKELERHIRGLAKTLEFINEKLVPGYTVKEYKAALRWWSIVIKKRDKLTCQVCGCTDKKKLVAHHLLYKQYQPLLSLNPNNGITLCEDNHYEAHKFDKLEIVIPTR